MLHPKQRCLLVLTVSAGRGLARRLPVIEDAPDAPRGFSDLQTPRVESVPGKAVEKPSISSGSSDKTMHLQHHRPLSLAARDAPVPYIRYFS